jgi:uncharacterized membrane protein
MNATNFESVVAPPLARSNTYPSMTIMITSLLFKQTDPSFRNIIRIPFPRNGSVAYKTHEQIIIPRN